VRVISGCAEVAAGTTLRESATRQSDLVRRPPEIRHGQQAAGQAQHPFHHGDDIGWYNVSAYNLGLMGYARPTSIASRAEGRVFTDWYGQQSAPPGARLHHRAIAHPHRSDEGRLAGARRSASAREIPPSAMS
jgi:arylsulfatase